MRSSAGYVARGVRGDPRGRKSGAGLGATNPRWPARAEGGKTVPLGYQEPISCDAKRGVMVKPPPVAALKVSQPQLLFQLLIVPFDNPAVFGHLDQSFELGVQRQR